MLDQKDFERIAEIVSGSVIFKLDTSMLQMENRICDKLAEVENRLEERITQVETKFDERITNLEVKYDNLDKKVSGLKITLDNDIDKKISIIAEGHLSLSRKLDESLRVMQKQEMMDLHIINLESKIREIKMQLGYPC
ncbi:MAG: hypothetical protein ACI4DZ_14115 [Oliverpabstia sp.]